MYATREKWMEKISEMKKVSLLRICQNTLNPSAFDVSYQPFLQQVRCFQNITRCALNLTLIAKKHEKRIENSSEIIVQNFAAKKGSDPQNPFFSFRLRCRNVPQPIQTKQYFH